MTDELQVSPTDTPAERAHEGEILAPKSAGDALIEELSKGKGKKYVRFIMAALGSVPWVGSYLSILGAIAGLSGEVDQDKINNLLKLWLQEHQPKLEELKTTLGDITDRMEGLGEEIQERIESPEYLSLVRRAFKSWDDAETAEKREYIKRLISNAGATKLCPDDLVRLFIGWIDTYHESHFVVIKEIYQNPGTTRGSIWDKVHTERPREDSAEADLFRYLVRDLSLGGVIRQSKDVNSDGQFMKKHPAYTPKGYGSQTTESAFEDSKPYVLTELGKEFVHYVLNDVVRRVEG